MTTTQYEEMEGLTADMVRDYLERTGWKRDDSYDIDREPAFTLDGGSRGMVWLDTGLYDVVKRLCRLLDISPQALLRDMNPRMRKGVPSVEARRSHSNNGGIWIASHGELGNAGSICFASWDDRRFCIWDGDEWHYPDTELTETLPEWSFWPCDAHGNKVPWPRTGEGE